MYNFNFDDSLDNEVVSIFENFAKKMTPSSYKSRSPIIVSTEKEYIISKTATSLEKKEMALTVGGKLTKIEYQNQSHNSFKFFKSYNKFDRSRIYGFKNKLEDCPDILLSKSDFKTKYPSSFIPDYNYELKVECSDYKLLEESLSTELNQIKSMTDYITNELFEIFKLYGDIEIIELKKGIILNIKNTINFYVVISTEKYYKLDENFDYGLVPNYKLNVRLFLGVPEINDVMDMHGNVSKSIIYKKGLKSYYFKIEFRYFNFITNKNFFVLCMTPHGYIRIKKEYSSTFFRKIIFHYLFKSFFETYKIDASNEDLEKDPSMFFALVAMLDY